MSAYEYKIVSGSEKEVSAMVNDLAQNGWEINGPVGVIVKENYIMFFQSLTKPTEQRGPWS